MTVEFDESFLKSIKNIRDRRLLDKVKKAILTLEDVENIDESSKIKKLSGFKTYYRYRIGDYRLGFEKIDDTTIQLIILAHRKDIYKKFP